jgi:hypothetical protein
MLLNTIFFDILPKENISPSGSEKSRVRENISRETSMPCPKLSVIFTTSIQEILFLFYRYV